MYGQKAVTAPEWDNFNKYQLEQHRLQTTTVDTSIMLANRKKINKKKSLIAAS